MTELRHELWLANRLQRHGVNAFAGDTTPELRRERLRAAILEHGLAAVIAGSRAKKPETYAQVFERLYGEPVSAAPKANSTQQDSP